MYIISSFNLFKPTLRAESPSIFLDKSGREEEVPTYRLPDLSRKIEGDSARREI